MPKKIISLLLILFLNFENLPIELLSLDMPDFNFLNKVFYFTKNFLSNINIYSNVQADNGSISPEINTQNIILYKNSPSPEFKIKGTISNYFAVEISTDQNLFSNPNLRNQNNFYNSFFLSHFNAVSTFNALRILESQDNTYKLPENIWSKFRDSNATLYFRLTIAETEQNLIAQQNINSSQILIINIRPLVLIQPEIKATLNSYNILDNPAKFQITGTANFDYGVEITNNQNTFNNASLRTVDNFYSSLSNSFNGDDFKFPESLNSLGKDYYTLPTTLWDKFNKSATIYLRIWTFEKGSKNNLAQSQIKSIEISQTQDLEKLKTKATGLELENAPTLGITALSYFNLPYDEISGYSVNNRTGAFTLTEEDFSWVDRGGIFTFERTYNSRLKYKGRFGHGWNFSHNIFLEKQTNEDVLIVFGDLSERYFTYNPSTGLYKPQIGTDDKLTKNGNVYTMETLDKIRYVFTSPYYQGKTAFISKILDRNNNETNFNYVEINELVILKEIIDSVGRKLTFETQPNSYIIKKIKDYTGKEVEYFYDKYDHLIKTKTYRTFPNESPELIETAFNYNNSTNLLTSYIDPGGVKIVNDYDDSGRITRQKENDIRTLFEIKYLVEDGFYKTITKTNRSSIDYIESIDYYDLDKYRLMKRQDGEGNIIEYTYDSNGNQLTEKDPLGYVTTNTYDSKNRLIKQTIPNTENYKTEIFFTYEDNFNQIVQKKIIETNLNTNQSREKIENNEFNTNGNLTKQTDALGKSTSYEYDSYGNQIKLIDALGNSLYKTYDDKKISVVKTKTTVSTPEAQNIEINYEYDLFGNKTKETDPLGYQTSYSYDSEGNIREITSPNGDKIKYRYDKYGNKIEELNPLGIKIKYYYDDALENSLIKTVQYGSNPPSETDKVENRYYYDWQGLKIKETDPLGFDTTFEYNKNNLLIKQIKADLSFIQRNYDKNSRLKQEIDELGNITDYEYDSRDQLIKITYPPKDNLSPRTFITKKYDGFANLIEETDGKRNITKYGYDLNSNLVTKTDADNNISITSYNELGKTKGIKTPLGVNGTSGYLNEDGFTTSFKYDEIGRLIEEKDSNNKINYTLYNEKSEITKKIFKADSRSSNASRFTTFNYDKLGRMTETKDSANHKVQNIYDALGRIIEIKNELNQSTKKFYDGYDRLTEEQDEVGNSSYFKYSKNNNLIESTDRNGNITFFRYDTLGREIAIIDSLGNITKTVYNQKGQVIEKENALKKKTKLEYDNLGQLTKEISADENSEIQEYFYDDNGNKIKSKKGNQETEYSYTALNQINKITYPSESGTGNIENLYYDSERRLSRKTTRNGITINYQYDSQNNLLKKTYSNNDPEVNYSFDQWNNLLRVNNGLLEKTYTYSELNLITSELNKFNDLPNKSYLVQYAYDELNRLNQKQLPNNNNISFSYDGRNNLSSVNLNNTNLITYTYDKNENTIERTFGNGLKQHTNFDSEDRLISSKTINSTNQTLIGRKYTYNQIDSLIIQQDENGKEYYFEYDNLDQLVKAKANDTKSEEISYTYDSYQNRLKLNSRSKKYEYIYNEKNNQLKNLKLSNSVNISFEYDKNGNLMNEKTTRLLKETKNIDYTFDSENRLKSMQIKSFDPDTDLIAENPSGLMEFAYDNNGNRIKKSVNGKTKYYLNDGLNVLIEINQIGDIEKTNIYGNEHIADLKKDGTIQYYVQDSLSSTNLITDSNGNIIYKSEYDPFGNVISEVGKNNSKPNYTFTNQEIDRETGLMYFNARYYNSSLGRFISEDPIPYPNLYVYANNNPLKYTDPDGQAAKKSSSKSSSSKSSTTKSSSSSKSTTTSKSKSTVTYMNQVTKAKSSSGGSSSSKSTQTAKVSVKVSSMIFSYVGTSASSVKSKVKSKEYSIIDKFIVDRSKLKLVKEEVGTGYGEFNKKSGLTPFKNNPKYKKGDTIVIYVHGTDSSSENAFINEKNSSKFVDKSFKDLKGNLGYYFDWSSVDSNTARNQGAKNLVSAINGLPSDAVLKIVAHSHGGNVVKKASTDKDLSRNINLLVNLGTPNRADYVENRNRIDKMANIYSENDYVQNVIGGIFSKRVYYYEPTNTYYADVQNYKANRTILNENDTFKNFNATNYNEPEHSQLHEINFWNEFTDKSNFNNFINND